MYDRAPRVLAATAPLARTSSEVGPGTYGVPDPSNIRTVGYAPFLSLAKRESFLTMGEEVAITPAPGHYNIAKNGLNKIKGGKALQNRSRRFSVPSSKAPGPGTYTLATTLVVKKRCQTTPAKTSNGRHKTFVSGRIAYKRQETAPSIPFPGKSYGYEEDEETGRLKPQQFPAHDTSLGPAFYNVALETSSNVATKKYKGIHFGSLKAKRMQFKGKDGPGPSDYDPKLPIQGASVAMQHPDAKLPRYHEIVPQTEEKKGIPGPGKYYLASQFEQSADEGFGPEALVEPPPFGSSQQRFITSPIFTPASTKYSDPRTALESLKRINGMTKSPFGQTSARFKVDRNAKEIPGPGAYNNESFATMSSNSKKLLENGGGGPYVSAFGTTSVRTAPMVRRDELYLPGPTHYQGTTVLPDPEPIKPSSMFLSGSKRLYSPPPIITTIPPPGTYNVASSYKQSQEKYDPKMETPNSAFLSSNSRFAPPRDIKLNETDASNPGPGEYEYQEKQKIGMESGGLICSHDTRFKTAPKTPLGPGTYKLSKPLQDTLLKGTHNRTLHNPLKTNEDSNRAGGGRFNIKETIVISNN